MEVYINLLLNANKPNVRKDGLGMEMQDTLKAINDIARKAFEEGGWDTYWKDLGRAEGRVEGIEEGKAEGIEEGRRENTDISIEKTMMIVNGLKKNIPLKRLAENSTLSLEQVNRIAMLYQSPAIESAANKMEES